MKLFLETLKHRNETLFYFSLMCLAAAFIFLILSYFKGFEFMGVKAWYKPTKFALSTVCYSSAMAWYCHYLPPQFNVKLFNWIVISMLGFEILYIALQAAKGQLSHYNISSPTYAALYSMMALAATIVTLWTAYIGVLFFVYSYDDLPSYYLWSIRMGILIFVIFSFEGFLMGSRMTHTIGGLDGSSGLPFLNWSTKYGDPRIAHFIGMHALQVLPLLSFFLLKSVKLTIATSMLYLLLASFTLIQALQGKPFLKI